MYTWLFWQLPGSYLQLPSATKIFKFFKRVYSDFPGSYHQLPTATKNVNFFKSVYWVASNLQLPPATRFYKILKTFTSELAAYKYLLLPFLSLIYLTKFFIFISNYNKLHFVASYLQLPSATYILFFLERVYMVASYPQLPTAT